MKIEKISDEAYHCQMTNIEVTEYSNNMLDTGQTQKLVTIVAMLIIISLSFSLSEYMS